MCPVPWRRHEVDAVAGEDNDVNDDHSVQMVGGIAIRVNKSNEVAKSVCDDQRPNEPASQGHRSKPNSDGERVGDLQHDVHGI